MSKILSDLLRFGFDLENTKVVGDYILGGVLWIKEQYGEVNGVSGRGRQTHSINTRKHMRKRRHRDVAEQFFIEAWLQ